MGFSVPETVLPNETFQSERASCLKEVKTASSLVRKIFMFLFREQGPGQIETFRLVFPSLRD